MGESIKIRGGGGSNIFVTKFTSSRFSLVRFKGCNDLLSNQDLAAFPRHPENKKKNNQFIENDTSMTPSHEDCGHGGAQEAHDFTPRWIKVTPRWPASLPRQDGLVYPKIYFLFSLPPLPRGYNVVVSKRRKVEASNFEQKVCCAGNNT